MIPLMATCALLTGVLLVVWALYRSLIQHSDQLLHLLQQDIAHHAILQQALEKAIEEQADSLEAIEALLARLRQPPQLPLP